MIRSLFIKKLHFSSFIYSSTLEKIKLYVFLGAQLCPPAWNALLGDAGGHYELSGRKFAVYPAGRSSHGSQSAGNILVQEY